MKQLIKRIYRESRFGFYISHPFIKFYQFFSMKKFLTSEKLIKKRFKKTFNYDLNLNNPKTLNEKVNWLIINETNPIATSLVDKYLVRNYIKEEIGEKYLIPLLFRTAKVSDIIPKNLPNCPFIIKTTHNSSGGIIIKNKQDPTLNWNKIRSTLRWNLADNYYWHCREKPYQNIQPQIIVEKLLFDKNNMLPNDYKVHCFNGKAIMTSVYSGRLEGNLKATTYSNSWEPLPYIWSGVVKTITTRNDEIDPKPPNFELMIELSEKLATSSDYLRIDWYDINNKLYFGEITFYHQGGLAPIIPKEWDQKLGMKLKLTTFNS
ncbi:glycosyl transferase [Aquimarina sp. ERC-38]|uniref:ATP-grasp fold amidoligase family protein n=1 Tax=Aquimarina sp. ERC-38 TaxID=2949996 RepID=UPI0022466D41|nr:ATP-grasp fold amidoligase family protein [Aquimarina sp. ERC-38]UZO80238.1 glycosyl transferase [Aquimarina sp. ERC-38]